MLRRWSVNMRLEMKGYKIPKEAQNWIWKTFAKKCQTEQGLYKFLDDGSLVFIGCPFGNHPFANSFGWFPAVFPYDDPYQAIYKGMTAGEFKGILKNMGFKEDKDV